MMTIKFSSIIYQLLQRKIAFAISTVNGDDVYYIKDIIDITLNVVGENKFALMLKEDISQNKEVLNRIGTNWHKPNGMKNKLKKMQKVIENTKIAYDVLEDNSLKKRESIKFQAFSSKAKFIPQIKTELSALFVFILTNSEFNNKTISPQHMKILNSDSKIGKLEDEYDEE